MTIPSVNPILHSKSVVHSSANPHHWISRTPTIINPYPFSCTICTPYRRCASADKPKPAHFPSLYLAVESFGRVPSIHREPILLFNLVCIIEDYPFTMSLALDVFGIISLIIVIIQILRSVIPWIYETWIGPALNGNRINFKELGEWAG